MLRHAARIAVSITLIQSLIFSPLVYADAQLSLPSTDVTAPNVVQAPINKDVQSGSSQEITATVTDDTGVKSVTLFYRVVGDKNYNRKTMLRNVGTDNYSAVIDHMPEQGLEYYIQAEDTQGNSVLHGYSFSPLVIHTEKTMPGRAKDAVAQNGTDGEKKASSSKYKWLWIGLGVLAVGAIASSSGGGGGDSGGSSGGNTGTVTVGAPLPLP